MNLLVIGGGKMGFSHASLATHYLGKKNVFVCDSKIFTRMFFRILGYQTFDCVKKAKRTLSTIDAIIIATPTPTHESLVRWSIINEIPCFVEKPLTLNFQKSEELKKLAKNHNCFVQVGFVMRYITSFQRLKKVLGDNRLGRIVSYNASMHGNVITSPPHKTSWQGNFDQGGGCLNEYGPHVIDLCCFIFGNVREILSTKSKKILCTNADDHTLFQWIHENSVVGNIDINWCDPSKRKSVIELNVICEFAKIRVDNSSVEIYWNDSSSLSQEEKQEINPPIVPNNVQFYLRGEEFSLEIEDFIGTCLGKQFPSKSALLPDTQPLLCAGCETDRLINQISNQAFIK